MEFHFKTFVFLTKEKLLEKVKDYIYNKTNLLEDEGDSPSFCRETNTLYIPTKWIDVETTFLDNNEYNLRNGLRNIKIIFSETELNKLH